MANYANAKATIAANIYTNHTGQVTAEMVKTAANEIVNTLIAGGYLYAGVAKLTPAQTNPGSPDANVFYIAAEPGTYTNFPISGGYLQVAENEVAIFKYNGQWSKETTGAATSAQVNQLGQELDLHFSTGLPYLGLINLDGTINPNKTAWRYSGLIPVKEGQQYKTFARLGDGALSLAYYDVDGEFLVSSPVASNPSATMDYYYFTIPSGVAYIRALSAYDSDFDTHLPYIVFESLSVPESLSELKVPYSEISFPNHGYLKSDGTFKSSAASWATTDYISVFPGIAYKCFLSAGGGCAVGFYDAEKNFLSAVSILPADNNFNNYDGVVPNGASYMRCCSHEFPVAQSFCHIFGPNNFVLQIGGYVQKYHDNLRKPYSFSGKKITFFGDSITHGVASDGGVLTTLTTNCYARLLANKMGVSDYENLAVSGSRFAGANGQIGSITSVITAYDSETDIIWVSGGGNDYMLQSTLGQIGDTTEATVYGALYLVCEYLRTNYPDAIIIFATPINWCRAVTEHNIVIEKYRDAIFEMATMYGFSVVDGSEMGFPTEQTEAGTPAYKAAMIYDGVHPTIIGHAMMADNLASKVL